MHRVANRSHGKVLRKPSIKYILDDDYFVGGDGRREREIERKI